MIQFPNFLSALHYQELCPLCRGKMDISGRDRDIATDIGYEYRENTTRISFYLTPGEDDVITINPYTEEVDITITQRRGRSTVYNIGSTSTYTVPSSSSNYNYSSGKFLHSLTVECRRCCRYHYVLQIHVDMANRKLAGVFLNSETIIMEEENLAHEIQCNYAIEKTKYSCFNKDDGNEVRFGDSLGPFTSEKKAELPLIPLNLLDPMETVSRVRKLLIFS